MAALDWVVMGVLLVNACGGTLFLPEERDWRRGWLSRCFDTCVSIEYRVRRVQRCLFAAHVRPARQADGSPFTDAHTFTGGFSLSVCCCFFDRCCRCRRPRLSPVVATAWRLASGVLCLAWHQPRRRLARTRAEGWRRRTILCPRSSSSCSPSRDNQRRRMQLRQQARSAARYVTAI